MDEDKKEATIKFICKNDKVFTMLNYLMDQAWKSALGEESDLNIIEREHETNKGIFRKATGKIVRKLKRSAGNIYSELNPLVKSMKDRFGYAIKEGRITKTFDFHEKKGGTIYVHCAGSPQEIKVWTNIRRRDSFVLKYGQLKRLLDVEVDE